MLTSSFSTPTRPATPKKQARVYAAIREMIQEGRIRAGEKLLEAHVARAFSVSRSPARHALETLCVDRLIVPCEGQGYVVAGGLQDTPERAALVTVAIEPMAGWQPVYQEVELQVCKSVLHHTIRILEPKLAEHFSVSRTVARDALGRLHSAGVVTKDRHGRWIADRITPKRIRDLYEVRCMLEPAALRQAGPKLDPSLVARARTSIAEALGKLDSLDSKIHAALESELHVDLLAACPNEELLRALNRTHLLLLSNHYVFDLDIGLSRTCLSRSLREHLVVIDCLAARQWNEAARLLHEHLSNSCEVWLQRFDGALSHLHHPMPAYIAVHEAGAERPVVA